MGAYFLIKTLHILSAAVLFGTGLGIAFFMFVGLQSQNQLERFFAARMTVRADYFFTLPAVIFQPISGIYLMWRSGFDFRTSWLLWSIALYLMIGLCWIPVVFIQTKIRNLLASNGSPAQIRLFFRWWFALGWPAFAGVIGIFWLMVAKP